MHINFTNEQIRELLLRWGYTFTKAVRHFRQTVYHNDVEEWENEKELLLKDGQIYKEPTGYGEYHSVDWFKRVFEEEFNQRFVTWVMENFK